MMYRSFIEYGAGKCSGTGPFDGLEDSSIAYLLTADGTDMLPNTLANFTHANTVLWDGINTACEVTVEFTPGELDPSGYTIQIGNPGRWRAGPYKPDPGPYGTIALRAVP